MILSHYIYELWPIVYLYVIIHVVTSAGIGHYHSYIQDILKEGVSVNELEDPQTKPQKKYFLTQRYNLIYSVISFLKLNFNDSNAPILNSMGAKVSVCILLPPFFLFYIISQISHSLLFYILSTMFFLFSLIHWLFFHAMRDMVKNYNQ